MTVGRC